MTMLVTIRKGYSALGLIFLAACVPSPKLIKHYGAVGQLPAPQAYAPPEECLPRINLGTPREPTEQAWTSTYKERCAGNIQSGELVPSVFVSPKPVEAAAPFVTRLAAEGQATLVSSIAAKAASTDALFQELRRSGAAAAPSCQGPGERVIERRIVFGMAGTQSKAADRLAYLEFALTEPRFTETCSDRSCPTPRFAAWDALATRFGTVNLGSAKLNDARTFGLGGSQTDVDTLTSAPPLPGYTNTDLFNLNASRTVAFEESVAYGQRYVVSSGTLRPRRATLIQQGAIGIDLLGNIVADLVIAVPLRPSSQTIFSMQKLTKPDGTFNEPGDIGVSRCDRYAAPQGNVPLIAGASFRTALRYVVDGDDTVTEADDTVSFVERDGSLGEVELLDGKELASDSFLLQWRADPNGTWYAVAISTGAVSYPLRFGSYDDARSFFSWLADKRSLTVGSARLSIDNSSPRALDLRTGELELVQCAENYDRGRCGTISSLKLEPNR